LDGILVDHATGARLFAEIRKPGRPLIAIPLLFGAALVLLALTEESSWMPTH
jgi:hypothetical protein